MSVENVLMLLLFGPLALACVFAAFLVLVMAAFTAVVTLFVKDPDGEREPPARADG